jgi:tetratricopeptide (TPR) repeat protein
LQTSLVYRAYSYDGKGIYKEAIGEYQKLPQTTSNLCFLGYSFAQPGKKTEALAILEKLKTTKEYVSPAESAVLYAGLGDKEGSITSLEKAYEAHDLQLQHLQVEMRYNSLRSDPRSVELIRKIGLTQVKF